MGFPIVERVHARRSSFQSLAGETFRTAGHARPGPAPVWNRRRHNAHPPTRKGRTGLARTQFSTSGPSQCPAALEGPLGTLAICDAILAAAALFATPRADRRGSGRSRRRASRSETQTQSARSGCIRDPRARARGRCTGLRRRQVQHPRKPHVRCSQRRTRAWRGSTADRTKSCLPARNARTRPRRPRARRISQGEQRATLCRSATSLSRSADQATKAKTPRPTSRRSRGFLSRQLLSAIHLSLQTPPLSARRR